MVFSFPRNNNPSVANSNFSSCSKLRDYHVTISHALLHLSMLLSLPLRLAVSDRSLGEYLSLKSFQN
jgi:hypothetical protein